MIKSQFLVLAGITLAAISAAALGQDATGIDAATTVDLSGSNESLTGGGTNIGEFIIDWIARGASFSDPQDTLFGALSKILNAICFALAAVIVGKHGIQYVTAMMAKGVPGGNQVAGGVTTVRVAIALGALTPIVGNGFSPVQVLVKNMATLGATVGDYAVEYGIGFLSGNDKYGNGSATVTPPLLVGMDGVVRQVMLAEACHAMIDAYYAVDRSNGVYGSDQEASPFTIASTDSDITYAWGYRDLEAANSLFSFNQSADDSCGSVTLAIPKPLAGKVTASGQTLTFSNVDNANQIYANVVQSHHTAIISLRKAVSDIVQQLFADRFQVAAGTAVRTGQQALPGHVEDIFKSAAQITESTLNSMPKLSLDLLKADADYVASIRSNGNEAARSVATYRQPNGAGKLTWQDELNNQGFAALGGYYWLQMKVNLRVMEIQRHLASAGSPVKLFANESDEVAFLKEHAMFPLVLERTEKVLSAYQSTRQPTEFEISFTAPKNVENIDRRSGGGALWLLNWIPTLAADYIERQLLGSTNRDIIVNMMMLGSTIVGLLEVLLIAGAIATGASALFPAGKIAKMMASVANAGSGGALDIIFGAIKMLMPLIIAGALMGVTMQYVFPAIPMIKWLVSLQSWAIMLFIGMIYAPVWMMASTAATSENWAEGKVYDGFIFLTELVLRPFLMVAGFYSAMLLMVVADIGARMAWPYFVGLGREGLFGLIGLTVVMALSVFVVYKLIVRTFDLVHELPDFVMRRLGAQPLGDAASDNTSGAAIGIIRTGQQSGAGAAAGMQQGVGQVASGLKGSAGSLIKGMDLGRFKKAAAKPEPNPSYPGLSDKDMT